MPCPTGKVVAASQAHKTSDVRKATAKSVAVSPNEMAKVQSAITQLGLEIGRAVRKETKTSFCLSPLSIAAVLGMILKGLSERDKRAFIERLSLDTLDEKQIHIALNQILSSLVVTTEKTKISVANAIGVADNAVNADYLEAFKELYKGEIFQVTQANAIQTINQWVKKNTNDQIPELFAPGSIDNLTCILVNALAFSAEWQKKFPPAQEGIFTTKGGDTVSCLMMRETLSARFSEGEDYKMVQIPYSNPEGHELSFIAFLPKDPKSDLAVLQNNLTADRLASIRSMSANRSVNVTMPKLDVKTKVDNLLDILRSLDLPVDGPLTELASANTHLSKIVHQAKLDLDEERTTGAAATGAIAVRSMGMPPETIDLSRPFLYFVMDGNNVIFEGSAEDKSVLKTSK